MNEKLIFLKTLAEFSSLGLSRSKLQNLCQNLFPVSYIKGKWLYKEFDFCNYIYFVRQGELKICMKVSIPQLDNDVDNV